MMKSDHVEQQFTTSMNTTHHASPTGLDIQNITKSFGQGAVALKNTSLTVAPGEMVALIGASGSGKSTLLRHVSGFLAADAGSGAIRVGQHTVQNHGQVHRQIRKMRSDIGFIFQQFNLFPHLTILDNCALAPAWVKKIPKKRSEEIAMEYLKKVRISEQALKYPGQLSGGQQQRAAIARALCMEPKIMLFDEPTSALDAEMIKEVLEIMTDLAKAGMTMIVVTHEMGFAREVASRMAFMHEGQIIEQGPPAELISNPQRPETSRFLEAVL